MGFGKPVYTKTEYKNPWALDKNCTSIVLRVLPPLEEGGTWKEFVRTHFGYKGIDSRTKEERHRPFACVEEKNGDGLITVECAECEHIKVQTQLYNDRLVMETASRLEAGMTPEQAEIEVKALLAPLATWTRSHSLDKKTIVKAKNEAGEFNYFKMNYTLGKELTKRIQELQRDDGIDALDAAQGVWFRFSRKGKELQTEFSIDIIKEQQPTPNGRMVAVPKLAPLTEADFNAAVAEFSKRSVKAREVGPVIIKELVQSSGDPNEVESIFGMVQKTEKSPEAKPAPRAQVAKPASSVPAPAPKPAAASIPQVDPKAAALAAQMAALQAQMAALQAPAANIVVPSTSFGNTPPFNPKDPDVSDDDFMNHFGG